MKSIFRFVFVMLFIVNHQFLMSQLSDQQGNSGDKAAMISGYVQLAASIISRGYAYLSKDSIDYDLQVDVLDHPYKNMVYAQTQIIEQLFDDANKHDNAPAQIRALILLCRVSVPEWYIKSFNKGLEVLYVTCFDEQGNFTDASTLGDIRLIFKDYSRKTPGSWQEIAKISDWWCRNKKPYPMTTQHYADTCTEFNQDLLDMIEIDQLQDLVYLQYLLQKNGSRAARKIYDYQISYFLKNYVYDFDNKK